MRVTSELDGQSLCRAPSFSSTVNKHGGDRRRNRVQKGRSVLTMLLILARCSLLVYKTEHCFFFSAELHSFTSIKHSRQRSIKCFWSVCQVIKLYTMARFLLSGWTIDVRRIQADDSHKCVVLTVLGYHQLLSSKYQSLFNRLFSKGSLVLGSIKWITDNISPNVR